MHSGDGSPFTVLSMELVAEFFQAGGPVLVCMFAPFFAPDIRRLSAPCPSLSCHEQKHSDKLNFVACVFRVGLAFSEKIIGHDHTIIHYGLRRVLGWSFNCVHLGAGCFRHNGHRLKPLSRHQQKFRRSQFTDWPAPTLKKPQHHPV